MSVKFNTTINGTNIEELSFNSKEQVIRICDVCKEEKNVAWNTVARCRKKHKTNKDYCLKCAMIFYISGDKNHSKNPEIRKKISLATKGKSKTFKDGKNYRILNKKITTNGYVLKWVPEENKHIQEHRLILAESILKHHSELDEVHHLNGIKTDNSLSNLIELNKTEHCLLHSQLENLAFKLVQKNFIIFDRKNKEYVLSSAAEQSVIERSYGFEDIAIKQKKNLVKSRLDVNIDTEIIRGIKRPLGLIAANMSTVINADFYIALYKAGAFGILHRADSKENIISDIKKVAKECEYVAASIGVENDQFDFCKDIIKNGCNVITIDIAHGYSDSVINLGKKIKLYNPEVKIILGNATNVDIIYETYHFADAIKVGIAQGLACETKNTAGCTEKQFSAVLRFKNISKDFGIPIISDGGIREPADFTKAIAAGANSIMAGSIFAACPESAEEYVTFKGETKKLYAGMASVYVQNKWKGGLKPGTCAEGGIRFLEPGPSLSKLLEIYAGALRSGITYAGGNDICSFQKNAEFISLK